MLPRLQAGRNERGPLAARTNDLAELRLSGVFASAAPMAVNPLYGAIALVGITMLLALMQPRWPLWRRAIWRLAVFASLTFLLERILGSPLHPNYSAGNPHSELWARFAEAAWWVIGARGLVGIVRLIVVLEHRPRETQIISDLLAGIIYIATALAVINYAFQVPISGLLATSGVIAIVLGLALQSTLADVFSGIAVGLERPFKAGDLLWVEGGNIDGRVVQVNWRSTQIATGDGNIATVPNSVIAKARLVNRSLPTPMRRDKIEVRVENAASPPRCIATMNAATKACRLLLDTPAPVIECTALEGDGNIFQIWFSVIDVDHLANARTELLSQLHRHLRHAGIALGIPGLASVPPILPLSPAALMAESDMFNALEGSHRDVLAHHLTEILLQPGEILISQGAVPSALFFVAAGTLEITVERPGEAAPRVVHRMGPGEAVGAIGLITGSAYAATATALTPARAYRLDKAAIAAAVAKIPELRSSLESAVERGREALRLDATAPENQVPAEPAMFRAKLRSFLSLLGQ
jgi:small-conductance mechanosensitive channel